MELNKINEYCVVSLKLYNNDLNTSLYINHKNILLANIDNYYHLFKNKCFLFSHIPVEISQRNFFILLTELKHNINYFTCRNISIYCAYFNMLNDFKVHYKIQNLSKKNAKNLVYLSTYYASINNNHEMIKYIFENSKNYNEYIYYALLETDYKKISITIDYDIKKLVKYDLYRTIRNIVFDYEGLRSLSIKYLAFRTFNMINSNIYVIMHNKLSLKLFIFIHKILECNNNLHITVIGDMTISFTFKDILAIQYIIAFMQITNTIDFKYTDIEVNTELYNLSKSLMRKYINFMCTDLTFINAKELRIPFH